MPNPRFPLYIVSKGRADTRFTSRALEAMRVPYFIVVEGQERDAYARVIDPKKILVLDKTFQRDYDTFDRLGDSKSRGSGPARNFVWAHALASGVPFHWIMDDNIRGFFRLHDNLKVPVGDGTVFRCMEDFVLRYENVGMAGPNYFMFASRKTKMPPFVANTRIYSCNLIRTDLSLRWRGRYNEDTDLSLRMLKSGWATVLFNAFLQYKMTTQTVKGGNTTEVYGGGTLPKSKMITMMHPDVSRVVWRFGRWHHFVDYKPFKNRPALRLKRGLNIAKAANNYGMTLREGPALARAGRPTT